MKQSFQRNRRCARCIALLVLSLAGSASALRAQSTLPEAPAAQPTPLSLEERPSILGTPKRILLDEVHVFESPAQIRMHDLAWLLPVAGATAAGFATDTYTMRNVVSRNPDFNTAATTSSDVLRGMFIGVPVLLFGTGELAHQQKPREAGLLAGEAMVDGYITSEAIKYITLRERPYQQNARGHFFQSDAVSDPSFVSGHTIVAWSSAAVLASEYPRPWQQIGIYTLASGVSLTRVLGQDHFPTDALLGSVSGWLIGRYVYKSHHHRR